MQQRWSDTTESSSETVSVIVPTLNERVTVTRLLRSLFGQEYRPIDVVVVDGGSKDGTLEALSDLKDESHTKGFQVQILLESDYGPLRGPANARNIGLRNCMGKYVFFFDADFVLADPRFVTEVCHALGSHPWVGVKVRPLTDTWLEFHCAVDDFRRDLKSNLHVYCAFRRDLLLDITFDPHLGLREDWDLGKRLEREYKIEPYIVEAWCSRHFAQTITEWSNQALWHGRTLARFMKKRPVSGLSLLIQRAAAGASLLLGILTLPLSMQLAVLFMALFLSRVLVAYLASSERERLRIAYLLLRESYWALTFLAGFMIGVVLEIPKSLGFKPLDD
jgi:glycosyltransferase involved in cell wall biosynthesis